MKEDQARTRGELVVAVVVNHCQLNVDENRKYYSILIHAGSYIIIISHVSLYLMSFKILISSVTILSHMT